MKLIDCRGLNCYLNCLVSAAAHLGVSYAQAFGALWSETDFSFDTKSKVFFTVRLEDGLAKLGLSANKLACASQKEAAASLHALPRSGIAIFGMDMYDVPWSPLYGHFNGPHYFAAQTGGQYFTCYDPTYGLSGMTLTHAHMSAHAYDIRSVALTAPRAIAADVCGEAENVLRVLPALENRLVAEFGAAEGEGRRKALFTARYTDALISNRYLYKLYLSEASPDAERLFDKNYFSRWEGVKNGLLKSSVMKNNAAVLDEVRALFCEAVGSERETAQKILLAADNHAE